MLFASKSLQHNQRMAEYIGTLDKDIYALIDLFTSDLESDDNENGHAEDHQQ